MKKLVQLQTLIFSLLVVLILGGSLFSYVYYAVATGGAFAEFRSLCVCSESITKIIGACREVKLIPYEFFYEKNKGETGEAGFTARLVGSLNTVSAKVEMKRIGNKWEVENIRVDLDLFMEQEPILGGRDAIPIDRH